MVNNPIKHKAKTQKQWSMIVSDQSMYPDLLLGDRISVTNTARYEGDGIYLNRFGQFIRLQVVGDTAYFDGRSKPFNILKKILLGKITRISRAW